MDPEQCKDERFLINPSVHHQEILLLCLDLMGKRLKKNICNLDDSAPLEKVEDLPSRCKVQIGDVLEYACKFWTKHLVGIDSRNCGIEEVCKAIDKFFTKCLLTWIEVLALMESLDISVHAINDIRQWYTSVSFELSVH